jgi:hypothetical protein
MPRGARVGDVAEIVTPNGLAYVQMTHRNRLFGALIRSLPGFFGSRPSSLPELVAGPSAFLVFYPLGAALTRKIVTLVEKMDVPGHARAFPLFRSGTPDLTTKKVNNWWFWNGEESWPVGALTAEQRKMPIRMIVNHDALITMLTSGWTPERDSW